MIDGKEKISYQIIYYLLSLILPYQIQKKPRVAYGMVTQLLFLIQLYLLFY